jgi:death-on-curing protein
LISIQEALFAHTVLIRQYGGSLGMRDQSLVESALARPVASFGGVAAHPTPYERTAVVWVGLIRNHGFVDGNKRTASMVMRRWAEREGWVLPAEHDDEVYNTCVAIANKQAEVTDVADWLQERLVPRSEPRTTRPRDVPTRVRTRFRRTRSRSERER